AAGKNFVLDTNVLLHDPGCLGRFKDNHVCIPVDVLAELDRFKGEQTERGANARRVHRELTEMFADGSKLTGGVETDGGGTMRLVDHGAAKPYEYLLEQGIIEVEALCYIRGRSIPNRFFVLDEAQQLTPQEAKTVVTRMSRGSKLVMLGDPAQIDQPYVDSRSNGLVYTRNRLKEQAFVAHVSLNKGERSPLAEVGAQLM
ncbi:MAG: PhoH family protein, partial [Roseibacillus sp.]